MAQRQHKCKCLIAGYTVLPLIFMLEWSGIMEVHAQEMAKVNCQHQRTTLMFPPVLFLYMLQSIPAIPTSLEFICAG